MDHPPARAGCPFCPGNEDQTPPETLAHRPAGGARDGPGWTVRAFANKFPVLPPEEGIHEVIVATPRHVGSLAELTDAEASAALGAWRDRLERASCDPRGLWPLCFVNEGAGAGASLHHAHAQVVAVPAVLPGLQRRARALAAADILVDDMADDGARAVAEDSDLVAWCPAVPPYGGTVRIAPRAPAADWHAIADLAPLGRLLRDVVARIHGGLGVVDLNVCVFVRPPGSAGRYHWHVDVIPRIATLAGLELGGGIGVVGHAPAAIAERLRAEGGVVG